MPDDAPRLPGRKQGFLSLEDGTPLARVGVCDSIRTRWRGLLGRDHLPYGDCVLLRPCRSVHTVGMRFPIDVAFVDRDGVVLAVRENVPRGWVTVRGGGLRTRAVIEAAAGAFAKWGLAPGAKVVVEL